MSNLRSISSANSVLTLSVEEIDPSGFVVDDFSSGDPYGSDNVTSTVIRMTQDGKLLAGFKHTSKPFKIILEPTSSALQKLLNVVNHEKLNGKNYFFNGTLYIPSLELEFSLISGVIESHPELISSKEVLEPTTWQFQFENVELSSVK
nr:MAG TPA: Protein of unknown function (DUF3277) [Caudoviricetes sp.]